jgi:hypothetical protein
MIDHQLSGLPLNKLGVMVVAAAKIKQWEAVIGQAYLNRIGMSTYHISLISRLT